MNLFDLWCKENKIELTEEQKKEAERLLCDKITEMTGVKHFLNVQEMFESAFEKMGEKDDKGFPILSGKNKEMVDLVIQNLKTMGIEYFMESGSIKLQSDNLMAVIGKDFYQVFPYFSAEMNKDDWEKTVAEVDNMNRAILQINGIQNLLIN